MTWRRVCVCAFVRGVCAFVRGVCMLCVCMRPSVCLWCSALRRYFVLPFTMAALHSPAFARATSGSSGSMPPLPLLVNLVINGAPHVFCCDAILCYKPNICQDRLGKNTGKVERRPFLSAGATLHLFVARWVSSRSLLPPPPLIPPCSFLATVSCGSS